MLHTAEKYQYKNSQDHEALLHALEIEILQTLNLSEPEKDGMSFTELLQRSALRGTIDLTRHERAEIDLLSCGYASVVCLDTFIKLHTLFSAIQAAQINSTLQG